MKKEWEEICNEAIDEVGDMKFGLLDEELEKVIKEVTDRYGNELSKTVQKLLEITIRKTEERCKSK